MQHAPLSTVRSNQILQEPSEKNQTTAGKKTKISKAERRAQQAEFNRQLWEDA